MSAPADQKQKLIALAAARAREKKLLANEPFDAYIRRAHIKDVTSNAVIPFELWPHLHDRVEAWDRGDSEIILKARQLGFSWLMAIYGAHRSRRPYSKILLISAGERESYELLEKVKFVASQTHIPLERSNAGFVSIKGGGELMALPSTENAGRSFTANLVLVDEAAFHPWAAENAKAYLPTIADGGQVIIASTSSGATGFFHDLYRRAEVDTNNDLGLTPVFVPWYARPHRDEEWERRTRARLGNDAFKQEYPATPEEAFKVATGLVFPQFSRDTHLRPDDPTPWEQCLYRYAAYDLGGGDPTACVVLGVYRASDGTHKVHGYDLFYKEEGAPTVDELFAFLSSYHERAPLVDIAGDPAPGGETVAQSLRALGLPVRKANNKRGQGLQTLAMFLDNQWLTFAEAPFAPLLREMRSYRWLTRVDQHSKDRYATSTPVDHHGDTIDAVRYALLLAHTDVWNEGTAGQPAYAGVRW